MVKLKEIREKYPEILQGEGFGEIYREMTWEERLEFWDMISLEEQVTSFIQLKQSDRIELIHELPTSDQEALLESLSVEHRKRLLKGMAPDDLVDLIQSISPEIRQAVWGNLSEESRKETEFLLRFDEDDAAGLMTPRFIAVQATNTVGQALNFVRKNLNNVETIYYIYIIDQLKRIMGVVSLRELLGKDDTVRLSEMMHRTVATVLEDTDQEEVAKVFEEHDLIALPVVDKYHRILGIVTVDDVIDVIREEQTEDVYKMGAMSGDTDSYWEVGIWGQLKKRIPWLIILLLAGTLTTNLLKNYEHMFATVILLSLFIPVITQTGGNTGTQSSTLMIRGIAVGDISFKNIGMILLKELAVGLIMGLILGVLIYARSAFLPPGVPPIVALVVGASLVFVILFSTLIGAALPLILHRFGIDPTVAAGPLMATVIDIIGLTIYFEVARLFLPVLEASVT
jgi:magnesium transporter